MDFKPVKLDTADAALLRKNNDALVGVQKMIQMFIESGERRVAQLQNDQRQMYLGFAAKYNLDLKHIVYVPGDNGDTLEPVQVLLRENPNG